jgi:serine/threonine protein phosphatase PrpC
MTPEDGDYSQMMLNVTRSLGDFYHQARASREARAVRAVGWVVGCWGVGAPGWSRAEPGGLVAQRYGVTWKPETIVRDLGETIGRADAAVLCVATDGVWDLWTFEDAMEEVLTVLPLRDASAKQQRVHDFFETSRRKGEEAFGDSADNLTGVVAIIPRPA